MAEAGEAPPSATRKPSSVTRGRCRIPTATFDCVIASEILEHVPADDAVIAELIRVLKVGGQLAVTVPRWLPEQVCWLLSDDYHSNEGGHIRIYRANRAARQDRRPRHDFHPHPPLARAALAILVAEMCGRR